MAKTDIPPGLEIYTKGKRGLRYEEAQGRAKPRVGETWMEFGDHSVDRRLYWQEAGDRSSRNRLLGDMLDELIEHLPVGITLRVCVEQGSSWVEVVNEYGDHPHEFPFEAPETGLTDAVVEALEQL
jgi:hypothetical protein